MTPSDILQARQSLGLTQEAFARLINVSVRSVARWEAGKAHPLPSITAAISKLLKK